jgi:hypothetical protein
MNSLLIGLGSIAKKHISALRDLKIDFNIYALRSNNNAEQEDGIESIFNLEDINVVFDFAIISNPTHLHFEYIQKLAHKGIDLFIEKSIEIIDQNCYISEFELYGNLVLSNNPNLYNFKKINTKIFGKESEWSDQEIESLILLNKNLEIISYHTWM